MDNENLERIETIERTLHCIYGRLNKQQRYALQDVIDEAKEKLNELKK
jgi:hypothetical protein